MQLLAVESGSGGRDTTGLVDQINRIDDVDTTGRRCNAAHLFLGLSDETAREWLRYIVSRKHKEVQQESERRRNRESL